MRGNNRVKHIYIFTSVSMGKIFENIFEKQLTPIISNLLTRWSNAESSCWSHGPGAVGSKIKKSNFACVYMGNVSQFDSGERCGPWVSCWKMEGVSTIDLGLKGMKHALLNLYIWPSRFSLNIWNLMNYCYVTVSDRIRLEILWLHYATSYIHKFIKRFMLCHTQLLNISVHLDLRIWFTSGICEWFGIYSCKNLWIFLLHPLKHKLIYYFF
jgi:hypothetical protein